MQPARHPRAPKALLLATLLAVVILGLAQCKLVEDKLTNVDPFQSLDQSRGHGSECIRHCERAFRDSLKEEKKLHKRNLRACCGHGDDDDDDDEDDDVRAGGSGPDVGAQVGGAASVGGTMSVRGEVDGGSDVAVNRGDDDDDDDDHHGDDDDDGDDDDGDDDCDPDCIRAENARHEAALRRIEEGRQECIRNCHHQGGGRGH